METELIGVEMLKIKKLQTEQRKNWQKISGIYDENETIQPEFKPAIQGGMGVVNFGENSNSNSNSNSGGSGGVGGAVGAGGSPTAPEIREELTDSCCELGIGDLYVKLKNNKKKCEIEPICLNVLQIGNNRISFLEDCSLCNGHWELTLSTTADTNISGGYHESYVEKLYFPKFTNSNCVSWLAEIKSISEEWTTTNWNEQTSMLEAYLQSNEVRYREEGGCQTDTIETCPNISVLFYPASCISTYFSSNDNVIASVNATAKMEYKLDNNGKSYLLINGLFIDCEGNSYNCLEFEQGGLSIVVTPFSNTMASIRIMGADDSVTAIVENGAIQ